MNCKNCKFWDQIKKEPGDEFSSLDKKYEFGIGLCNNAKFVYTKTGDEKIDIDGLAYYDDESYLAYLYTGEEFGCIHFEEIQNV